MGLFVEASSRDMVPLTSQEYPGPQQASLKRS